MSRGRNIEGEGMVELLSRILWKMPLLEGAACVRKAGIFSDPKRVGEAKAICEYCPAINACRRWSKAQHGLTGVVAGELRGFTHDDEEGQDDD